MTKRDWCRKEERQRGHVWTARWSLTLPDGARRFGRVTEPTKRECEDAVLAEMGKARSGSRIPPDKVTVAEWLDEWLADHARAVRPQTAVRYEQVIRVHLTPHLGAVRLQRLSERDIRSWMAGLERAGVSASMVAYARRVFAIALRRAVQHGLLDRSPLLGVKAPRVEQPEVAAWTIDEAAALHRAAGPDDGLFVLGLERGLRRGELLGLKWEDIDLERGVLHVRRQRTQVGTRLQEGPPKTKQSRRDIVLPPRSVAALKALRRRQLEQRLAAGPLWRDAGYVAARSDGEPWSQLDFERAFAAWRDRAGVRPLTPHAMRHTFATNALAAGVHPKLVQETLGHASIAMTLDRYSHVSEEMQREAAARVERLLGLDQMP